MTNAMNPSREPHPAPLPTSPQSARPGLYLMYRRRDDSEPELVLRNMFLANRFFSRFMGLMFRRRLAPLDGLLLVPCNSIHSFFMRFTFDAVCLDPDYRVIETYPRMRPSRIFMPKNRTHAILELDAGDIEKYDLRPGDQLTLQPIEG